jgi:hypothetical protein
MEQTNERKLAHIEIVSALNPIEGADKIEVADILGWKCVVKKGEFKVGDKVVYVEVDSVMPEKPEYEFLKDKKYRIKTIKLKGQVSQGLVLPIENNLPFSKKLVVGQDVTEWLGITKYLSPSEKAERTKKEVTANKLQKFMMRYSWFRKVFLSRTKKQSFPFWVNKTDEERIQNIPHIIKQFEDKFFYVTEKIDYQSVTFTGQLVHRWSILGKFSPLKYQFVVCSRNLTTNDKNSLYWQIAKKYNIEQILKNNPTLTIQGEQGDTNVQGNKYGLKEPRMWVFNIIDHEKNYFYNFHEIRDFCIDNDLEYVPLLQAGELSSFGTTVEEIVNYAKGKSTLANIPREGVVFRCVENGHKLSSFKAINPDFLLKYE